MASGLRLIIRTPHEVVLDAAVASARVPTGTGQVGLRPREEPLLLVVEPGLVVLAVATSGSATAAPRFAATAGGLLESDGARAILYTPFAAEGDAGADVLAALDRALATPDSELAARKRMGELEQRIVDEIRQRAAARHLGASA